MLALQGPIHVLYYIYNVKYIIIQFGFGRFGAYKPATETETENFSL